MNCFRWLFMAVLAPMMILEAADSGNSKVTMIAVGSFGEALTSCRVDSFRLSNTNPETLREYADHFRSLTGTGILAGQYDAFLRCNEGPVHAVITVEGPDHFQVVSRSERLIVGERGDPKLVVTLDMSQPPHETMWVRLVGVYNQKNYLGEFGSSSAAKLDAPDPGTYLVTVLSTGGYECVSEVDLFEDTRSWTFHRSSCTFDFDRYAHPVRATPGVNHLRSDWYIEMQKEREMFLRDLREASKKQ